MIIRNILLFVLSTAACFVGAKLIVAYSVVPLEQQQPLVAQMQLASSAIAIQYSESQPTVDAVFEIKNLGDRRLVVNPRETNCDCTVGKQAAIIVPPGESGEFRLPLSMKRLGNRDQVTFSLGTNDPNQPIVPVSIQILDRPPFVPVGATSVLDDIAVLENPSEG